ncbi:MAG TPA: protein kinase [Longimicrobiales bacterium]|nr:protein kinase [Longimicrobiales bacterium]
MTSNSEHWAAVKQAVTDALDLPSEMRSAFLDRVCSDPVLRAEAGALLRACEQVETTTGILELPAAEFAAGLIVDVNQHERAVPDALEAELAGRYTIQREIGRGGMATVYIARDDRHGRLVAVKVVHAHHVRMQGAARFQREIEIAARLTHPHILPLHDSGAAADWLYYIMPFVEGETLRERLARTGAQTIEQTVHVLRDVAEALAHAHQHGVVHRDIKPANILLNQGGDALVSDFGVAKAMAALATTSSGGNAELSMAGVVLGTPAYIAPEQAVGDPNTDQRADLYALGVVAYEMLAGVTPLAGASAQELVTAQLTKTPAPIETLRPHVPPDLAALIARLLAKRPADRPQTASEVLDVLNSVSTAPAPAALPQRRARLPRRTIVLSILVLVAVAAAVKTLWPAREAAVIERSIAVLPFANTSGVADNEPFSDGLTDELIVALSRVPGLKVAARTSTFALKGKALSPRTIADTLGVTTLLEGSVRRAGDQLKVTASLVDARDNRVLWTDTYDNRFSDIFAVQEEIARAIVAALSAQLAGQELPARLVKGGTDNLQAYQLYLKARFLYNTRQRENLQRAAQYLQQAVELDPGYARAYAALAEVYNVLGIFGFERPHDTFPRSKAAAERAIALDSSLAEAHAVLAHERFVYEWNWKAAEPGFQKALALNPRLPATHLYYGIFLHVIGRHDEALAQMRVARALDPLLPTGAMIGRLFVNTHQPDSAILYLKEALELNPRFDMAHQQLAHAYLQKGMRAQAIASMRQAAALSGPRDSAQLAYTFAVAGQPDEARRILNKLRSTESQRYLPPFHIALAYAGLEDRSEALRWLERGYDEHSSFMDGLAVSEGFQSLRGEPRFAQLLRRMGLQP